MCSSDLQKMTSLYKALQKQQNLIGETASSSPKPSVEVAGEALSTLANDVKAAAAPSTQTLVPLSGQKTETGTVSLPNKSEPSPVPANQKPESGASQASQEQQQSNTKSNKKKRKGKNK